MILLLYATLILSIGFIAEKLRLTLAHQKMLLEGQYARELLQIRIEIQSQTLSKASAELLDDIGQLLSVARLNLNILEETEQIAENRNYIIQANETVRQSIQSIRDLTTSLGLDFEKSFNLEDNLSAELRRARKSMGIATEMTITGERYRLNYEKELVLFRISQEIIDNIGKHATAANLVLQIVYGPDLFVLRFRDDGPGFDTTTIELNKMKKVGAGLSNVKRRTELIGGHLKLRSDPGEGTTIEILLPIKDL